MPTLNWIGKEAVLNHHKEVPFRLLKPTPKLSVGEPNGNLLIEGDNLEALKALLPHYAGQVKCIYIDPPYNTGNENWAYNDRVNSTQIRNWLGKVVGGEQQDLSRHDKWLCMMYPRLKLLQELLNDTGGIFISIDDNEVHNLRQIMDGIFGETNFVALIIWQRIVPPRSSAKHISTNHDYILVYAKDINLFSTKLLPRREEQLKRYKNLDNDSRGLWAPDNLSARNPYSKGTYAIKTPSGRIIKGPPKGAYWRVSEEKFWELVKDNRIWWGKNRSNVPTLKRFLKEVQEGITATTWWDQQFAGDTAIAKKEVKKIFDGQEPFITPKPVKLIKNMLNLITDKDSIILDSFAGSGTTGHAVLELNKEDGGKRRFILVELEEQVARTVTAERLRRVIQGYTWKDQNGNKHKEPGLGGDFQYCTLGETIFHPEGAINSKVKWEELARHIWFTETYTSWPGRPRRRGNGQSPTWLGDFNGTAYYLYFNGIGGNIFGPSQIKELPKDKGTKVVYADVLSVSPSKMKERSVIFKQIPYEVKVK